MTLRNSILVTKTKSEYDFEYLYQVEVKSSSNSRAESSLFRKNLNSFSRFYEPLYKNQASNISQTNEQAKNDQNNNDFVLKSKVNSKL